MTRVQLAVMGLALAFLPAVTRAAPTAYEVKDFTLEQGTIAPSIGGFVYDPLTGFSSFSLDWRGQSFDLTYAANNPYVVTDGATLAAGTHADAFALLTQTLPGPGDDYRWFAETDVSGNGAFTRIGFQTDPNDARFVSILFQQPGFGSDTGLQAGGWTVTPIPEAASLAMAAAGLLMVSLRLRGRRG